LLYLLFFLFLLQWQFELFVLKVELQSLLSKCEFPFLVFCEMSLLGRTGKDFFQSLQVTPRLLPHSRSDESSRIARDQRTDTLSGIGLRRSFGDRGRG
jgi:hypothetical protein